MSWSKQINVICNKLFKDIMELKRMMEKLGQAKTHLELKKMIAEVDTTNSGIVKWSHCH